VGTTIDNAAGVVVATVKRAAPQHYNPDSVEARFERTLSASQDDRMLMPFRSTVFLVAASAAAIVTVSAQERAASATAKPVRSDEVAAIAQGWTLLSQGQAAQAASRAAQILQTHPRSAAALTLAVEAHIATGGAAAGLGQYEQWLGQRSMEEPLVLRRVSYAALREEAAQKQDPAARLEAIRALAGENDPDVEAELAGAIKRGARAEVRALAAMGNEDAVKTLVAELNARISEPVATIPALARSGSGLALGAIVQRLSDPRPEVRGAAVDGLATIGGVEQIPRLKPLLSDPSGYVRTRAAAALFRLDDDSGVALLRELAASEPAASRLIAAQAMADRPDAAWQALVRELTDAREPEIQVAAARLLAPHDPERARQILEQMSGHENIAIRELATRSAAEIVTTDLSALRKLMRNPDRLTRVKASARVVQLTR
jgi:hypothetical protein